MRESESAMIVLHTPHLLNRPRIPPEFRVPDDAATGDRGAETINLDDDTTSATVCAHRAATHVGHNDGSVGDAATTGLNDADGLTRQGRDCPSSLDAVGEKLFGGPSPTSNGSGRHRP
jgi:hypothetical protein